MVHSGGPVVESLPPNAGDSGLIPGWGTKIPHAVGQLSLCANGRVHILQLRPDTDNKIKSLKQKLKENQDQTHHSSLLVEENVS